METNSFEFFKATVMILSDRPTYPVSVVFFHNRSFGDDANLTDLAAQMRNERRTRFIAVTNNEGQRWQSDIPYEANPGKTYYKNSLLEKGVPDGAIVVPERLAFHTREENTAFIELARDRGWRSGAILAHPHQALRTMLGAVQAMDQLEYMMELYTVYPDSTSWQEEVQGNQGAQAKPREEYIKEEFDRIILRQQTGELATFEELFAYLEAKERGRLRLGRDFPPQIQGELPL